jgi:hypothetical protein
MHGITINEVYEAIDEMYEIKLMGHNETIISPLKNGEEIFDGITFLGQGDAKPQTYRKVLSEYEKHKELYLADIKKRARIANIKLENEKKELANKKKTTRKVRFDDKLSHI